MKINTLITLGAVLSMAASTGIAYADVSATTQLQAQEALHTEAAPEMQLTEQVQDRLHTEVNLEMPDADQLRIHEQAFEQNMELNRSQIRHENALRNSVHTRQNSSTSGPAIRQNMMSR